jgi:predicted patatin/cPLA2 family phospholipase
VLGACASNQPVRQPQSTAQLLAARQTSDTYTAGQLNAATAQLLRRVKGEYDDFAASRVPAPPVVNMLILSGGGDWGAFGAGFLKGWKRVPAGPLAEPQFDVVTGVSTGALIAPFAFLGDDASIDAIVNLYRKPDSDLVKRRSWFSLLRGSSSFAQVPGLERAVGNALDIERLSRIADDGAQGRQLWVNLTNVDTQEMHVWNIVEEARRAVQSGDTDRVEQILLGSAAVPGVFPPREIDGVLYIDGGLTGNILIGGPQAHADRETVLARWLTAYPQVPLPRIRYWIIFNNKVRWSPEVVPPRMGAVLSASMTASTRSATINCMRLLILQAELARLKNHADIEVRIVAVPDSWVAPKPGSFVPETMNALADLGEKMGADPASWRTSIPEEAEASAADP